MCSDRGVSVAGQDLSWFREHGFHGAQPGNHFTARAQERVLQQASAVDARVALLESVFVTVELHVGRQEHVEGDVPATSPTPRSTGQPRSVSNFLVLFSQQVGNLWTL